MPGKYGSASIVIQFDASPGGSLQTITGGVLEMSGLKIVSGMQDVTAYGDTFKKMLPTGVNEIPPITLSGLWDTTATTGSHPMFKDPDDGPQDATRTLTIGVGDSKVFSGEGYLVSYEVVGKAGDLTRFTAVIQLNSATWA